MNIIKTNRRALQSGTTLVELSVVIAVILLLVSVLFIGVTAWKNSANRAACLVNLATLQKAVRGYQNSHADDSTITGVTMAQLVTDKYFGTAPVCPLDKSAYNENANPFPGPGVAGFTCNNAAAPNNHTATAANLANW
jgi:type II secretory pathway pseudopilin PulG